MQPRSSRPGNPGSGGWRLQNQPNACSNFEALFNPARIVHNAAMPRHPWQAIDRNGLFYSGGSRNRLITNRGGGRQIHPGLAIALRSSITETYCNNPTSHLSSIQATTLQVIGDKTTFG